MCNKYLKNKDNLRVHYKNQHPEENIHGKCFSCDIQFNSSHELQYHTKSVHSDPENHIRNMNYNVKCLYCEKIFSRKYDLNRHMKAEHKDKDPMENFHLECDIDDSKETIKFDSEDYIDFDDNDQNDKEFLLENDEDLPLSKGKHFLKVNFYKIKY